MDIPRRYKMREHHLRDALKTEFPEVHMVFDKKVDNGCSRRRPDVRIEQLTHSIIVECDENQHRNYSCENKRTMELFRDLGNRPMVLIRFNPDSYVRGETSVEGCFKKTKSGAVSIRKKEWNRRIAELTNTIHHYLHDIPSKEVEEVRLFYNTCNS